MGRPLSGKTAPKGRSRVSLIERFGGTVDPAPTSVPERAPALGQQMGPVVAPISKPKKKVAAPISKPKKKVERVATKKAVAEPEESPVVALTRPNADKNRSSNQVSNQKAAVQIAARVAANIAANRANKP